MDWSQRESVIANLRRMVRRILRNGKYPLDAADLSAEPVLQQGEVLGDGWAGTAPVACAGRFKALRVLLGRIAGGGVQVASLAADRHQMPRLPHFGLPDAWNQPDQWDSVRRTPRHNDEAITGTTRLWLRQLPPGRRPQRLCVLYPRVANAIAWSWRDPVSCQQMLEDLLTDRRGGRQGFPKLVVMELRRLRDHVDHAMEPEHAGGYLEALRQLWSRH